MEHFDSFKYAFWTETWKKSWKHFLFRSVKPFALSFSCCLIFDDRIIFKYFSHSSIASITDNSKGKTSMMWPSQNFLLYNGTVIKIQVNEWINNLKKYVNPPPYGDTYNMYKL